jgi:hypothetical protein
MCVVACRDLQADVLFPCWISGSGYPGYPRAKAKGPPKTKKKKAPPPPPPLWVRVGPQELGVGRASWR